MIDIKSKSEIIIPFENIGEENWQYNRGYSKIFRQFFQSYYLTQFNHFTSIGKYVILLKCLDRIIYRHLHLNHLKHL